MAPEDLLIIKAAAHSELCPNHWHDATALLSHASLDWAYLIRRARRAPRRILSLLLYAQSNDIWVPNHVIHELFSGIFGAAQGHEHPIGRAAPTTAQAAAIATPVMTTSQSRIQMPQTQLHAVTSVPRHEYAVSHLRECLAEDPRTNELDILIEHSEGMLLLRGEVGCNERREAVGKIASECFPDIKIENQVRVLDLRAPAETESLS